MIDASTVNSISLCGYTDWRLPKLEELQTIVDYSTLSPALNTTWFPNSAPASAQDGDLFWTSANFPTTPVFTNTNNASGIVLRFTDGTSQSWTRNSFGLGAYFLSSFGAHVRLVRSDQ